MSLSSAFRKLKLIAVGITLVVLAIVGAFAGVDYYQKSKKLEPFQPRVAGYLEKAKAAIEGDQSAALARGIVVVDVKDKEVDHMTFDLPETDLAATPDDVKTVAFVDCTKLVVGKYGSTGGEATQQECRIDVLDLATNQWTAGSTILGAEPPKTSKKGRSQDGGKPTTEIIAFLKGLPRA